MGLEYAEDRLLLVEGETLFSGGIAIVGGAAVEDGKEFLADGRDITFPHIIKQVVKSPGNGYHALLVIVLARSVGVCCRKHHPANLHIGRDKRRGEILHAGIFSAALFVEAEHP